MFRVRAHLSQSCLSRVLLACVLLCFQSSVFAQQTGKIAYVDTQTLLNTAPQRAVVLERLRIENKKMQDTLTEMSRELDVLNAQLEQEADPAKQNSLKQQILDKQTLITRRSEAIQESFLLKRNDAISAFQQLINQVIAETAKKQQLDAVLTQASVVYVNPRIDITAAVMQALVEKHQASIKESGESVSSLAIDETSSGSE